MSLYIVSDLHIRGAEDPFYLSLIALLRDRVQKGDVFVLAGDLFDLFVGNKAIFLSRYGEFLQQLRQAGARGVELHYIEGNHDFLIQRAFRGIPNLKIHPQDCSVEMEGKRFYFAHGDLVDSQDYKYRALRAFFRSPFMKALVWIIPGSWLDKIGEVSSSRSRKQKPALPTDLPLIRMEYLRNIYRSYAAEQMTRGFDYVVMGHCHDLDEMCFMIGGRPGQYINVGFPRIHGSFLSWEAGDEKIRRERLPS